MICLTSSQRYSPYIRSTSETPPKSIPSVSHLASFLQCDLKSDMFAAYISTLQLGFSDYP